VALEGEGLADALDAFTAVADSVGLGLLEAVCLGAEEVPFWGEALIGARSTDTEEETWAGEETEDLVVVCALA